MSTIAQLGDATQAANPVLLDLFSISQKIGEKCIHHAPYLCVPPTPQRHGHLAQGCCNDWLCPRCGPMRARHEYGRMVEGARTLSLDNQLYMLTITCNGDEDWQWAEQQYLDRTNRFLSTCRAQARKSGGKWAYAQVTERQKRLHPHSHFITTFAPNDIFSPFDEYERYLASVSRINAKIPYSQRFTAISRDDLTIHDLHSEWLMLQAVKVGLGVQARISEIDVVEGASRYISKYLFKDCMLTEWPKKWRRVRYSNSWPKLPRLENSNAFPVITASDWQKVAELSGTIETDWPDTYAMAQRHRCRNVVLNINLSQV